MGVGLRRARIIARWLIVAAHSEPASDRSEEAPVKGVVCPGQGEGLILITGGVYDLVVTEIAIENIVLLPTAGNDADVPKFLKLLQQCHILANVAGPQKDPGIRI